HPSTLYHQCGQIQRQDGREGQKYISNKRMANSVRGHLASPSLSHLGSRPSLGSKDNITSYK
ncbi:MAG: hypothetical protein PVI17_09760, partial [Syntrophobacterales bacterium]